MAIRPRDNRTSSGAKKRWTPEDRARRDDQHSRGKAPSAREQRRAERFGPAPAEGRPARAASRGREDRPARAPYRGDDRPAREPYRRPDDRPYRGRDEQADERREGRPDRRVDWYPGPRTKPAARGGRDSDREAPRSGDRFDRFDRRPADRIDRAAAPERRPRTQASSSQDRNASSRRPGIGDRGFGRERPFRRDDRGAAPRPERRFEERPERRYEDRAPRRFEERRFDDRERPQRRFEERPERRYEDRAPRRFEERPERRFDDRERPQRRFEDRERPERRFEERPAHRPEERPERRFDDQERPQRRFEDRERPERRFEERPQRRFEERQPRRTDDRSERPARYDDRAPSGDPRSHGRDAASRRPGTGDRGSSWTAPEDVVLDKLEGDVVQADDVVDTTFGDLGLGDSITRVLAELGAVHPFPIQAVTIPDAIAGRHVLGRGRTGSGKTIAFGAAMVERLLRSWQEAGGGKREPSRAPRALILAPTRELALQIDRTVQPLARSVRLFTTQLVGGVPYPRQVGALRKGVDIVIGTPGRVEDLVQQGVLDLSAIEITVLDEADHMAELGFLEPMQRLLRAVPAGGQRLLFSATLDSAVATLVDEFLPGAAVHEVVDKDSATAEHRVLVVEPSEKVAVLAALLGSIDRALVFARTRAFAEQLADDLEDAGVRTESLHGDLNQSRRTRNLGRFSEGKVKALVATDVAARGIHVDDVELVVHADAAEDYKTYLHRSGRTGRAGASGIVVTLLAPRRRRRFEELLDRAGIEADFVRLQPGADPVAALAR